MRRTTIGRIVYDHPPHLFTYRDVRRIVQKVDPARPATLEGTTAEAAAIVATILAVDADLVRWIRDRGIPTFRTEDLIDLVSSLVTTVTELARRGPAELFEIVIRNLAPIFYPLVEEEEPTDGQRQDQRPVL